MSHIRTMASASGGEWGWRNERRRAVLAHAIGFLGANLVCGALTLFLLHVAGPTLGWALPASVEMSALALALGAACMLAGAALLMPGQAHEPAAMPRAPSPVLRRNDTVGTAAPRRFAGGSRKGS